MSVKVVEPVEITEAVLTASDIPEPDASAGEVEWQDFDAKRILAQITYPAGYNYLAAAIVYDDKHPIYRYYVPLRATGSTTDYIIARYDEDLNHINNFTIELNFAGDFRLEGFSYSDLSDSFLTFWGDRASPYGKYTRGYRDLNKTIGTGLYPQQTLAFSPADLRAVDSNATFCWVKPGVIAAAYEVGGGPDRKIITMQSGGATPGSVIDEVVITGGVLDISSDGERIHQWGSDEETLVIKSYSDTLSLLSTEYITNSISSGMNYASSANGLHILSSGTSSQATFEPMSYAFVNAGSYKSGEQVISTATHKVYQCLVQETFDNPVTGATGDESATWIEVGPTNKWAMFDDEIQTKTQSNLAQWNVEFETDRYVDTVAVIGSENVTSCLIRAWRVSDDVLIYTNTVTPVDAPAMSGPFAYANPDLFNKPTFYVDDIPVQNEDVRIGIRFNSDAGSSVGAVAFGAAVEVGDCIAGTRNERLNLGRPEYNEFGQAVIVERPIINLSRFNILSDKNLSGVLTRFFDSIATKNALWIGELGNSESVITYGIIQESPITYDMPTKINYNVTVRGSI